jgi:hypothetical protein
MPRRTTERWIASTLLALLAAAASPSVARADCPVPGTYAVTISGRLPSGVHFARLALYSFDGTCNAGTGNGSVTERFWYFPGDAASRVYGSTHVRVGVATDPTYARTKDKARTVRGSKRFNSGPSAVATLTGSWSLTAGSVDVTWSGGDTERWRHTWQDATLDKLELVAASYVGGSTYLSGSGTRDPAAETAGVAFGGPGSSATLGVPIAASGAYSGLIHRHNAWCGAPASDANVYETGLTPSLFHVTSTGVLRYVTSDGPLFVFSYLTRSRRLDGILARRVAYQTSHDFDGDGHVADDLGHVYSGLEVLGSDGHLRGFVFADSSPSFDGCDENNTISSIWYLDTADCDALYGIDPENPGEC